MWIHWCPIPNYCTYTTSCEEQGRGEDGLHHHHHHQTMIPREILSVGQCMFIGTDIVTRIFGLFYLNVNQMSVIIPTLVSDV
jgi:hypothetical protein